MSDALTTFVGRITKAAELSGKIAQYIEDHMGVNPDEVGWDDAGDAGRMVGMLTEIVETYKLN